MSNMEGPPVGAETSLEKKKFEYDPVEILQEREIGPEVFGIDERGRKMIEDKDFAYITSYLRDHIKSGSVLNLGGGFMHAHRILPAIDKITHATSIDISETNNEVTAEFLEGAASLGEQEWIDESDLELLRTYAEALAQDSRYGIKHEGRELLTMLHEKSKREGEPDLITADIIAQMKDLGSGELLEGRTYDNILLLWSIFTRDRDETLNLLKNAKQRLNEGGRIVVMDVWDYAGVEEGDVMRTEDPVVAEKYPKPWLWSTEEFVEILKEVGLNSVSVEEKPVEVSKEEEEAIGGYICFVAEE